MKNCDIEDIQKKIGHQSIMTILMTVTKILTMMLKMIPGMIRKLGAKE